MSTTLPRPLLEVRYAHAAQAYLASLPPEHFMEATPQATQREITVESLALLRLRRPDVHYFNELLVQYPVGRGEKIGQVVPDNMVVVYAGQINAEGSYDVVLQPATPLLVLEYVSRGSKRKDYKESFQKYERELKVPYYLVFYPERQEVTLFRRGARKYQEVRANQAGRLEVTELELEAAVQGGWVRFWHRGELLALPAELQTSLEQAREQVRLAEGQVRQAQEGEAREREQKERLLAQLRQLGVEPKL